jgi:hypothetical protein
VCISLTSSTESSSLVSDADSECSDKMTLPNNKEAIPKSPVRVQSKTNLVFDAQDGDKNDGDKTAVNDFQHPLEYHDDPSCGDG